MSTALAHRQSFDLALAEPGSLFAGVEAETIASLCSEHSVARAKILEVAAIAGGESYAGIMNFFLRGNCEGSEVHSTLVAERVFQSAGALKALNASSWQRALAMTDVYQVMPQDRRTTWDESIKSMEVPEFDEGTVHATLGDLLASRQKFFAERVDGIFRVLSGEHVTNSPRGFRNRMIIAYLHNGWYSDCRRCGYIADLRSVIAKFMGRDEPGWSASNRLIDVARRRRGEWIDVDGGALRLRVYKKGTAHLEVHPSMAWRLNAVLASLYPRAIPSEHRTREARPARRHEAILRPLPFAVLNVLADMRHDRSAQDGNARTMPYDWKEAKAVATEVERVLESIGGTLSDDGCVARFGYTPDEVLDEVLVSGCLPDRVSHQYYPTPRAIAEIVVELAGIRYQDEVLEPSAGQGGIADLLPKGQTLCVEVNRLHCLVLAGKGLRAVEADFLEWAATTDLRFDRVVMNPPFSEGRALQHLRAAASLLRPGGRLVAVLPGSMRGKADLLAGLDVSWHPEDFGGFQGTSIRVSILIANAANEVTA